MSVTIHTTNLICFKHVTVELLQAGRNEDKDQSSVPQGAVGGKSQTVGC